MQRKRKLIVKGYFKFKPYLPFIILSLVFVLGVFLGSILVCKVDLLNEFAADKLNEIYLVRSERNFLTILRDSVLSIIPFYIFLFICGTSVIGAAITPIMLLYKGFIYGLLSGYLYSAFKLEGIMFSAFILLPVTIVSVFGLLLLAKESIFFSYLMAGICIKSNKPLNLYTNFKSFCINSGLILILGLFAVLLDVGLSTLFVGYFNF